MGSGFRDGTVAGDVALLAGACSGAYLAGCALSRIRIRKRLPLGLVPRHLTRVLPLIGMVLCATATASAGGRRAHPVPPRPASAPAPPWSRLRGISPPLPRGRDGVGPWVHPASHIEALGPRGKSFPLFERSGRNRPVVAGPHHVAFAIDAPTVGGDNDLTGRSSIRRPDHLGEERGLIGGDSDKPLKPRRPRAAGQGNGGTDENATRGIAGTYRVVEGDTLWDIAAHVLHTDDPARIARLWPRIHRLNRDLIGPNPNLIRPGQNLKIPMETRP